MKTISKVTLQTKKRANSKHWDTVSVDWVETDTKNSIWEPKKRALVTSVINCPDSETPETIKNLWSYLDMVMTALFFCNSARLGVTYDDLLKAVTPKMEGKTDYADIQVGQLKEV